MVHSFACREQKQDKEEPPTRFEVPKETLPERSSRRLFGYIPVCYVQGTCVKVFDIAGHARTTLPLLIMYRSRNIFVQRRPHDPGTGTNNVLLYGVRWFLLRGLGILFLS
jgi:hypothetical protein